MNSKVSDIAIECIGIEKRFGTTRALKCLDLSIRSGTIHALVGQNGAGKSTMLGVLAGRIEPSSGRVRIFGTEESLGDPRAARALGIVAIYQELTIIPALSAVANVFLGQTIASFGVLNALAMRQRFIALCEQLAVSIDPDVQAQSLSVADQQILEIMRAIQADARVILFDEPTASLAPPERQALFKLMRDLRDRGHTMIFVSHNLDEVFKISDDITVFRNGSLVEARPTAEWTKPALVATMLGESMGDIYHHRPSILARGTSQTALVVDRIHVPGSVGPVSFSVKPGEIIGIGGLVGSGRTTLLRAIAGLEPLGRGLVTVAGHTEFYPRTPRAALARGIALVPEDRKQQGLVLGMSSRENITLAHLQSVASWGIVSEPAMHAAAEAAATRFGFDKRRLAEPVGQLSGGNQQKALLARWSHCRPAVLLVDEPTRGIDIGAKSQILDALRQFAEEGIAVVIVSSELEELSALADRIEVLAEGHHIGTLTASSGQISVASILNKAFEVHHHCHV